MLGLGVLSDHLRIVTRTQATDRALGFGDHGCNRRRGTAADSEDSPWAPGLGAHESETQRLDTFRRAPKFLTLRPRNHQPELM